MKTIIDKAVEFLEAYRASNGGGRWEWYAGIASDPRKRLFVDHNVSEQYGQWAHYRCDSDFSARRAEDTLLTSGYRGGDGGGGITSIYVYIYRIKTYTIE